MKKNRGIGILIWCLASMYISYAADGVNSDQVTQDVSVESDDFSDEDAALLDANFSDNHEEEKALQEMVRQVENCSQGDYSSSASSAYPIWLKKTGTMLIVSYLTCKEYTLSWWQWAQNRLTAIKDSSAVTWVIEKTYGNRTA